MTAFCSTLIQRTAAGAGREWVNGTDVCALVELELETADADL